MMVVMVVVVMVVSWAYNHTEGVQELLRGYLARPLRVHHLHHPVHLLLAQRRVQLELSKSVGELLPRENAVPIGVVGGEERRELLPVLEHERSDAAQALQGLR